MITARLYRTLTLLAALGANSAGAQTLDLPPMTGSNPGPASRTTLGGYGDMHYNLDLESGAAEVDLHRLILFVGYDFSSAVRFRSELEVEHAVAGDGKPGHIAVEQAFIDVDLLGEALTLRAGMVLVPMGRINLWHEPPIFNGVERPLVEKLIIPSTWREGGVGLVGKLSDALSYQAFLVGGLDASGFSAKSGLRGGRQGMGEATATGLALTGRVDYKPLIGARVGVSGYYGLAGPNAELFQLGAGGVEALALDVPVTGLALDAQWRVGGFELAALWASFWVGDAASLSAALDGDGAPLGVDVASQLQGGYLEVGYDLLDRVESGDQRLIASLRVERLDTTADQAGDGRGQLREIAGLRYHPHSAVTFKADLIFSQADDGASGAGLDLGLGFMF